LQCFAREFKEIPDETLSRLKDGICFSLSEYFYTFGSDEIIKFLTIARSWNDSTPISDELREYFEKLYPLVDACYIQKKPSKFTHKFVGDNLQDVLIKSDKILLSNPWHAIAVQKQGSQWYFFDPNHSHGPILCTNTEELLKKIQHSLGTIISVGTLTPDLYIDCQTEIKNISLFIKHGGFLSLGTLNEDQQIQVISAIENKIISEIDLSDGLNFYSNSQKAVWQLLDLSFCKLILKKYPQGQCKTELTLILTKMQERVDQEHHSTNNLIPTSEALPPSDAPVTSSAGGGSSLTPETKAPSTVVLEAKKAKQENTKAFQTYEQIVQPIEHFYSSILKELTTWERTEKVTPQGARHFIFHLLKEEKTLVRIPDAATILELRNGIQQIANHPVYYVDKAEDLQIIMKRFQVNTDGRVSIEEGSPLSDFLQSTGSPKTILINYDHFSTEEIIQFNEILDKEPKINGKPLPEGVRIIGLQNTSREDAYQESDFYSRFTHIRDFSSDASEFREVFSIQAYAEETTSSIELYNDPAWKAILFGQLRINGKEFIFVPGALNTPELPLSLILKNAPVDDPEFIEFWRQAIITGKINLYGKEFIIPKGFQLKHVSGYDLETLSKKLSDDDTAPPPPPQHVLNSQNLHVFLGGQIIQNGEIVYQVGLIENEQPLSILLTEALSEGQWAKLLQAYTTTPMQIQSLADINIPDALKALIKPYTPELSMTIVQTNDVEQYLHTHKPEGLIVDVSDFDTPEVFGFSKALLQTDRTYRFESRDSWLINKLNLGEKVILKGHFSERIIQGIAQHILLNPEWGKLLTLIGDAVSPLKRFGSIKSIIFDEPRTLTEEQERSLSLLTHPELKLSVNDQSAKDFTDERMESIQYALGSNPFVFITGLSGCGKTTFIKNHFQPYLEKQGIDEWLKSKSDPCYLFFDEANLSHENWLMFEGLLQNPPFIIFEGEYREVPHTHKVIFAGNPVTYGDERKIPKLFSGHPNVIVFDPIPPQALKEEILLPLFENTEQQGQAHEICEVIIQL
ncbi:MAG TPA: hypothetical protein DCZ80_01430, partial [Legionellales bacterium]|nr:hypothetical protein [Legionellales bacterium]